MVDDGKGALLRSGAGQGHQREPGLPPVRWRARGPGRGRWPRAGVRPRKGWRASAAAVGLCPGPWPCSRPPPDGAPCSPDSGRGAGCCRGPKGRAAGRLSGAHSPDVCRADGPGHRDGPPATGPACPSRHRRCAAGSGSRRRYLAAGCRPARPGPYFCRSRWGPSGPAAVPDARPGCGHADGTRPRPGGRHADRAGRRPYFPCFPRLTATWTAARGRPSPRRCSVRNFPSFPGRGRILRSGPAGT